MPNFILKADFLSRYQSPALFFKIIQTKMKVLLFT